LEFYLTESQKLKILELHKKEVRKTNLLSGKVMNLFREELKYDRICIENKGISVNHEQIIFL